MAFINYVMVRTERLISFWWCSEQSLARKEPDFVEPARELFLWNVLMNRRDTATLFWDEGRVSAQLMNRRDTATGYS